MHQQIIGSNTGLTSVDGFAPGYSSGGKTNIGIAIYNTGTLTSQFQADGCEVFRSSLHDDFTHCGAAGIKNIVKTRFEQGLIHFPVSMPDADIFPGKTGYYFFHHFCSGRGQW